MYWLKMSDLSALSVQFVRVHVPTNEGVYAILTEQQQKNIPKDIGKVLKNKRTMIVMSYRKRFNIFHSSILC